MPYVLGIDLGTSSLKGVLMNQKGEVITAVSSSYPLIHPAPGFSEQDPAEWIKACDRVFTSLSNQVADFTAELEAISFSGQMHSLVLLDEKQQLLRNAILWNDVRTTAECKKIMSTYGPELIAITQNVALEGFTLPKILWVQANEPEIWKKVRYVMMPKDYLGFWITDTIHMDYSDAAGTLLLDVEAKQWSQEILDQFAISKDFLPELTTSLDCTGEIKPSLVEKYGFKKSVQVFAGGADNACAAVGAGILDSGIGMVSIGTSGVFLSFEEQVRDYEGKLHLFNHAKPEACYSMGVTLSAGHSLNWFKETFASDCSFESLLEGLERIPPGSEGLLFTPYIVGERTPHADSQIRGSFIGIDARHTIKHFTRAVLEGITFSLKESQVLMEEITGRSFRRIVSVGGGAKNQEWLQMQADIFNTEISCLTTEQGPALGAAMLAAVGTGWFSTLEECGQVFVKTHEIIYPNPQNAAKYHKVYNYYQQAYSATKDICHGLMEL